MRPRVLVFDSGIGGLSVLAPLAVARPDAAYAYVADTALFPYGALDDDVLVSRVLAVIAAASKIAPPDLVVVACNTASTLVLEPLRRAVAVPVVGTVPAVKPAAHATRSGLVSVLATPGTVRRDYTRALIDTYATHLEVTLAGSTRLAAIAERVLAGQAVADADLAEEAAPCFIERGGRRTDVVVLACTHYAFVRDRLAAVAPWPVEWIDPAPAIARRAASLMPAAVPGTQRGGRRALVTGPCGPGHAYRAILARFGIDRVEALAVPV